MTITRASSSRRSWIDWQKRSRSGSTSESDGILGLRPAGSLAKEALIQKPIEASARRQAIPHARIIRRKQNCSPCWALKARPIPDGKLRHGSAASVSGWYFAHPEARYFGVGKIQRDQVIDYAARKGWTLKKRNSGLPESGL